MTEVISNVIRDIEKLLQIFKKERVGRIMKKFMEEPVFAVCLKGRYYFIFR